MSASEEMKFTIQVPEKLYQRIERRADAEGRTVPDLVSEWLEVLVAGADPGVDPEEARQAWLGSLDLLAERIAVSDRGPGLIRDALIDDRR
jgi:hypothetical protein